MATIGAAAGGAAAAAAIAQAIKASGAIIQLEPSEFLKILSKIESPFVVTALGGAFSKNQYLTNYNGLHIYWQMWTKGNSQWSASVIVLVEFSG